MLLSLIGEKIDLDSRSIFKVAYSEKIIKIEVSGSSKQYINGSKKMTQPEYAIYPWDKNYDWCSNCYHEYSKKPWITFSLINKQFKFNGYFVRNGCCYYNGCCCDDDFYGCIDCYMYSWSLQISNDNKTWTTVHQIEKDSDKDNCKSREYKFDKTYTARYVRLIQDAPFPGYPPCFAINRFDLFGTIVNDDGSLSDGNADDFVSYHDDDDDVSIIGHISKNGNAKFD
ncbi:hypothetical protein TVAG_493570 [Trichomonas vaginalis G3]|uniref:F5/8 type C domain-containing protein n=1 Tax=Trichomonas vaginalis (strain ATCC PRA-98 / G3) TaxID=412133 RepID=A2FFC3_TRIV3|nr:galactose-binding domain-like family [Trichomonas vaginalis G3]EAX96415.1 hypothetical protein TVAG_493570 [Trichomonas vaginalis G3]KAI5514538.1 galactose-binding domain-like family [Trichomonas vaginalis G3]|eukprot:XP_001309345.1 hypothetical protein [Trichomonas vaginalis G3]